MARKGRAGQWVNCLPAVTSALLPLLHPTTPLLSSPGKDHRLYGKDATFDKVHRVLNKIERKTNDPPSMTRHHIKIQLWEVSLATRGTGEWRKGSMFVCFNDFFYGQKKVPREGHSIDDSRTTFGSTLASFVTDIP